MASGVFAASDVRLRAAAQTPPSFTVNTESDAVDASINGVCAAAAGQCSLRAAIAEANATTGATIRIPAGTYLLNGGAGKDVGDLQATKPMTIAGAAAPPGAAATTIVGSGDRVLDVSAVVTVTGVVITGGSTTRADGGGISVARTGSLTLRDSTLTNNTAPQGGGVQVDGTARIERSTIANNVSTKKGGGVFNAGTLTLTNSTVDGNSASGGGGVASSGTATIVASTITRNSSNNSNGGGIYRVGGTFNISSSILALNNGPDSDRDCYGTPTFTGYNLVGSQPGCNPSGSNILSGDPRLGALANNGGPTFTRLPQSGSPVVDVVPASSCAVQLDQRSVQRPSPAGGKCDLGAVEVSNLSLSVTLTADRSEVGAGVGTVPIQNIPPDALFKPSADGSGTIGAAKFGAIKFGAIDVEASKFGAITLEDLKFGAIKFGAIDLAAVKFGAITLSDIEIDVEGGWAAVLQGTQYEGAPLQALTFEDVVDIPAVQALTLSQIRLEDTLLRGVALEALALGEFPIAELALTDAAAGGTPTDRLLAWCAAIGTSSCAAMGVDPLNPASADNITPLTLNIAGISLESVDFASIKFGAIDLSATKFGAIKFGAIKFGAIDFASTKFGAIKFGAIKFGAIDLSATKFGAIKFGAIDMRGTKFGAIKFGAIPAQDRSSIIDCALVDCANNSLTLADAALVGALRGTLADIINLSDVSEDISELTLADLFALVGLVSDLDDLTIAEFFELAGVAEIDGLSIEDLLPLLLDPGDLPWQLIDLDATPLQNVAVPTEPVLTYSAELTVGGLPPSSLDVTFTLAPGFVYVPGTATFDGSPIGDPQIGTAGTLAFALPGVSIGQHDLSVGTRAGLTLGVATTSVEAVVTSGTGNAEASGSTDVVVVESFELGDGPDDVKVLSNGVVVVAHLSDAFDQDLYTMTITPEQAAGGATADIYLSNLPADYDLVLYGPPLDPLRGEPTQRINGLDDQGIDSSPADDVVAPDPLNDLYIDPPPGSELHSLAANRQRFDEHLRTGTLRAGTYYVQVSGYNGAFEPEPFTLRLRLSSVAAGACPPRAFPYATPGVQSVPDPSSYPADLKTLFLVAPRQTASWYGQAAANQLIADVNEIAAHPNVVGGILPVDSAAAAAYANWNANPCSFEAANSTVRAIGESIDAVRAARPSLEHIVIVGDHASIPMAMLVDGTTLSNQRSFAAEVGRGNEIGAAFAGGRFLSDDPYASPAGVAIYNHEVFKPDLGLGRLVGRPEVIGSQLQRFLDYDGQLDPATAASPLLELNALVTGYDFLADGATAIANSYANGGADTRTLIDETWSADDLRAALLGGARPDVASINAHFDPWRLLPADQNAAGTQDNLFTTDDVVGAGGLAGTFIYTMGCNSGVNLSDVAIGLPLQDWSDALAAEGALFAGNGGFGYGDTEIVALSERYFGLLTDELVGEMERTGGAEIGQAWMVAKQQYQSEVAVWTPYDEKAVQAPIFYGLPMWRIGNGVGTEDMIGPPLPAANSAPGAPTAASLVPTATDTVNVSVAGADVPDGASGPSPLERFDTDDGSFWLADGDGQIEAMYRPIEPQVSRVVGTSDARGALITALTSYDINGWDPRYFLPRPTSGTSQPAIDAVGDAIFPATLVQVNPFLDGDGEQQHRLLVSAGQFRPTAAGLGTQRVFTDVGVELVTPAAGADLEDTTAPIILRSNGAAVGNTVGFTIDVAGNPTHVSVLYKPASVDGRWVYVPLVRTGTAPDGLARWTGGDVTGVSGVEFEYVVQAHDATGNTSFSNNKASDFLASPLSGSGDLQIGLSGSIIQAGWFKGAVTATITSAAGAEIEYSVDGSAFVPYEGAFSIIGEGVHILRAKDATGAATIVSVPIDTVAPIVEASVDPPPGSGGTGTSTVKIDAADPGGSGVDALIYQATGADPTSGEVTVRGRTASFAIDATGTTIVTFRAVDAAGNQSASQSLTIVLDNDPPSVVAVSSPLPNAAGWITQNPAAVNISASDQDGVKDVRYSVNGGSEVVVPGSSASVSLSTEGTSVVQFGATDLAGNASSDSITVKIDSVAPQVELSVSPTPASGSDSVTGPVSVQVSATDAVSGVASLAYAVNSGPESPVTGPITVSAQGVSVVRVVAKDAAGNTTSASATINIYDAGTADTDGDGVLDVSDNCVFVANPAQENTNGEPMLLPKPSPSYNDATNPSGDRQGDACDNDDDGDGIPDATETSMLLSPLIWDTDGDRVNDGTEVACGSNPLLATSTLTGLDSDNDRVPDACEAIYGTDPSDVDTDNDFVLDGWEIRYWMSNPLVANSDADDCADAREVASVNADRQINAIDLNQLSIRFGALTPDFRPFDMNGDGSVNSIDLAFAAQRFGPCLP